MCKFKKIVRQRNKQRMYKPCHRICSGWTLWFMCLDWYKKCRMVCVRASLRCDWITTILNLGLHIVCLRNYRMYTNFFISLFSITRRYINQTRCSCFPAAFFRDKNIFPFALSKKCSVIINIMLLKFRSILHGYLDLYIDIYCADIPKRVLNIVKIELV